MTDNNLAASTPHGSEHATLTHTQLSELLTVLDNTRHILDSYVEILEEKSGIKRTLPRKSWWGRHCFPKKRRVIYKHITIVTVTLQFLNLAILTLIDAWPRHDTGERQFLIASSTTMIVLQLVNLFVIILASGRLVKQIYRHSVNSLFMGQSYLATILLFAGIYTLTYRLDRTSWKFISENLSEDPVQVFTLYAKFLFYSISTATLCGSDNVLPVEWYNTIFAAFQMLLSFCYFASILGSAMSSDLSTLLKSPRVLPVTQPQQHVQEQQHDENEHNQDNKHGKSILSLPRLQYRQRIQQNEILDHTDQYNSGNDQLGQLAEHDGFYFYTGRIVLDSDGNSESAGSAADASTISKTKAGSQQHEYGHMRDSKKMTTNAVVEMEDDDLLS